MRPLITLLSLVLLLLPSPGSTAPKEPEEVPLLAVLVAQTFLRAVSERDLSAALPLCAEVVDFDGEVAKGTEAVRRQLSALIARMTATRPLRRIVVASLEQARKWFGPPPGRLVLPSGNIVVGFGRFHRGGLVIFIAQDGDRYRVIALTD